MLATCDNALYVSVTWFLQPPPQALRFSHGKGERETRVTGDEPQGTMGSLLPAFLCAHIEERDIWVRGSGSCIHKDQQNLPNLMPQF